MKKYVKHLIIALVCVIAEPVCAFESSESELAVSALSGKRGYGLNGECIQSPGAQAGAYVYAGSYVPYPEPAQPVVVPDSLDIVYVAHVGRHGSRYLSSDKYTAQVLDFLRLRGNLTPVGLRVRQLCEAVDSVTDSRWGALDELGCKQQSGIGRRFAVRYGSLLHRCDSVEAQASYVPRCVMSMDEMTHGLIWDCQDVELSAGSGKRYDLLLRPFDVDEEYKAFKGSGRAQNVYQGFCDTVLPAMVVLRLYDAGSALVERLCKEVISEGGSADSGAALEEAVSAKLSCEWPQEWVEECGITKAECLKVATALYKVVGGIESLSQWGEDALSDGVQRGWQCYFTSQEYYRLWECENLRHYLNYSASGLSLIPERLAVSLLRTILDELSQAASDDYSGPAATLRFGHAETLMPLYSLLDLPGCRYITSDWGSVSEHWMDWNIVPMAANLQMVLCRSKYNSQLYLITYRDEQAVGTPEPWSTALPRLQGLLPRAE